MAPLPASAVPGRLSAPHSVSVVRLGGHTPGSQAVLIDTDAGRVCLAGDILYFYRNLELNWPVGSYFDVQELMRAYAWMKRHADIVVPQHDWKFYEIYPQGFVG